MPSKLLQHHLIYVACLMFLFGTKSLRAEGPCDSSHLPTDVTKFLEAKYPSWKIETLADLGQRYKKIWQEKHEQECPGFASGRFHGNGENESYAVLLIPQDSKNYGYRIIVLTKTEGGTFVANVLESSDKPPSAPVVISRVPPGKYFDAPHWKDIKTNTHSIFVERLEVAGRLYYWKQDHFVRIPTSY